MLHRLDSEEISIAIGRLSRTSMLAVAIVPVLEIVSASTLRRVVPGRQIYDTEGRGSHGGLLVHAIRIERESTSLGVFMRRSASCFLSAGGGR